MNYLRRCLVLIMVCIGFIVSCKKEKTEPVLPEKRVYVYAPKEIAAAIKKGDLQKVKQYIEKGGDFNSRCQGYFRGGREKGKNDKTDKDWTLLMLAVFHNQTDIVKFLLEKADVNAVNAAGHSALFLACAHNYEAMALLLLKNGANANLGKDQSGTSTLQWALVYDLSEVSSILIDKGAYLNTYSTETGRSVLMDAFFSDSIKPAVAHKMIDLGADVRFVDQKSKETPLMWACRKNDIISVKKMIEKGARVNMESDRGDTALEFAAGNSIQDADLLRYLVSKGANVNGKNVPLVDAVYSGSLEKVKFLIEKGADVNKKKAMNGIPPLFEAGFNTNYEIMEFLINNGADVNIENTDGESVLHHSLTSFKGSYKVVKLLIERGANVNFIDKDKRTPLMKAAQYETFDIANLLIENGATKEGIDVYGKTAKMYARESAERTGDKKILSLFE